MKHILVIANGELDPETARLLPDIAADGLIAVDGGANHCRALGLVPSLIIGDLDSLAPETLAQFAQDGVPIERHPAQKDETDLELALLRAVHLGAERIILSGALGGRLDMALANVMMLARSPFQLVRIEVWAQRSRSWVLRPPGETIPGQPGDTLSLIPLCGDADGLTTEHLAYPLRNETLRFGHARGLSNVFTGPVAHVQVRAGLMLAVHTLGRA